MPSVIINNLFRISELIKLTNNDPKAANRSGKVARAELDEEDGDPIALNRNILFERKIILIKCKYLVIQQFAKKNYFLQLHEGTGWDIYWTDKQFLSPRQLKSMMPYQRINYFPGMSILTNKQNLTQRLNLYKSLFPGEYNFFPHTWILDKHCQNVPLEEMDTNNAGLRQERKEIFNNNQSQERMTNKDNLDLCNETPEYIFKSEHLETPLPKTMDTLIQSPFSEMSPQIEHKDKTESSEPSGTDNGIEIHTRREDKSDELLCHNCHIDNQALDELGKNEINKDYEIHKRDQHEISDTNRRKTPHPMYDITNQLENTQEHVLRDKNASTKHTMFSEAEHKCDKTIQMNDNANTIEHMTDHETNVLPDKRNTKDLDNELKSKTNSITSSNLRPTLRNNNSKRKSVNEIAGTPNILLKDNVRNMVQALNRINKTIETVDKWRTITKENVGKRKHSCDQDEDTVKEHDGTRNESKYDDLREKVRTESEDLEEMRNNGNAVKEVGASENESMSSMPRVSAPIYILKPCDGCQGKGIQLTMNINEALEHMAADCMVCQEYITNPLLWNGYKFDIRLYVLVTSVKQLRVYIYNQGLVRLATEKYEPPNEANMNNMCMHLTNYSINKDSEKFDENLSKRSLDAMNRFLTEEHGVDLKRLYGRINDIIVKTILAGYKPILKEYLDTFKMYVYREACFQLLGFDILLDTACNPYLLEINKNASLKRPTPIDKVIKTKLTRDLFSLLNLNENRFRGDILRDNLNYNTYRKHYIEHEINHRGDFGMIYPCNGQDEYTKYMID